MSYGRVKVCGVQLNQIDLESTVPALFSVLIVSGVERKLRVEDWLADLVTRN